MTFHTSMSAEKYNDDPRDLGNISNLDEFYSRVEVMMTEYETTNQEIRL